MLCSRAISTGPPHDRVYAIYTSALLYSLQWRRRIARLGQLLTLSLLRLAVRDAERCLNIRGSGRQVVVSDFLLDLRPPKQHISRHSPPLAAATHSSRARAVHRLAEAIACGTTVHHISLLRHLTSRSNSVAGFHHQCMIHILLVQRIPVTRDVLTVSCTRLNKRRLPHAAWWGQPRLTPNHPSCGVSNLSQYRVLVTRPETKRVIIWLGRSDRVD